MQDIVRSPDLCSRDKEAELLRRARGLEIRGRSRMTKEDLARAIARKQD
jgi:hypothetical protein